MSILKYINRLRRIDQLVSMKATGSPRELAEKLEISPRRLHEILDEMKILEVPIKYNRSRRSYYYYKPGRLKLKFEHFHDNKLNSSELEKTAGGSGTNYVNYFYCENNAFKVNNIVL